VNGEPLFIRGGNWIVSDGLLRLSEDRYNTDVGFHADMNLNMIRVWGGALAERPEFYNACDKRGILVSGIILLSTSMGGTQILNLQFFVQISFARSELAFCCQISEIFMIRAQTSNV
jgi:hypothetical protein